MNTDTINAIQKALAPVAEKIGQGAAYGWEVVVRQQYINGIASLITALGCLTGVFVCIWAAKWCKKNQYGDGAGQFFSVGGVVGFAMLFFCFITDGVQHLLNPAYYALDFFINLAK